MSLKNCNKCGIDKPLSEYHSHKKSADGLDYICKDCSSDVCLEWQRSKNGLVSRIYNNQRGKSKRRGHALPDYAVQQLRDWITSQVVYHTMHRAGVASNDDRNFVPSCDRIDDDKPYTLDNIQLMTWKENDDKGSYDLRHGRNATMNLSALN